MNLDGYSSGAGGLPYKIANHKRNWAIWFSFFLFDGCILPIILFYSLWYGSHLSKWTIFALITSLSFWTSYHKWFSRGWRLLIHKSPKYRPINGRRWAFDMSYFILSLALLIMILELVIATSQKNVRVRVISIAPPSTLYVIGLYMLIQNTGHVLGMRAFFTISSVKRGSPIPPPLFTVMEDVFAVDGAHEGFPAREAMRDLYSGSSRFRRTLMGWSWVWGIACTALAIGLTIVVARTSQTSGFGVAYGVSWPFIVIMALITSWWMERQDARGAFSSGAKGGIRGTGNGNTIMSRA